MLMLVLLAALLAETKASMAAGCVLGLVLIPLVVADLRHQLLPDPLTMTLFAVGLLATFVLPFPTLPEALFGALLGSGFFLVLRVAYIRLRGMEALGLGDVKLMAGLGAWFGPAWLPLLVVVAASGGLVNTIIYSWMTKRSVSAMTKVPFGAYLGVSALLVWLLRDTFKSGGAW